MAKRKRGKSRKIRIGGILITKREDELISEFGNSSYGYDIECRFCGWKSVSHEEEAEQKFKHSSEKEVHEPGYDLRKKGFRTTLKNCANNISYVPSNVREWKRRHEECGENW